MADTQNSNNPNSLDNNGQAHQAEQTDQAVASGNAYELIKDVLANKAAVYKRKPLLLIMRV